MKFIRAAALSLGAVIVLMTVVLVSLLIAGWNIVHGRETNPVTVLAVAPTDSLLARGEHLVSVNCVGCHGVDHHGPLIGSHDDFWGGPGAPPLGRLYAPNLTPGGPLRDYSDGELARAIREGVDAQGHSLLVMPSADLRGLSDRDVAALIVALRHEPRIEHDVPARRLEPLAYMFIGLHLLETSHQLAVLAPIPERPEAMDSTYGAYLVPFLGCRDCHGPDLKGGRKGQIEPLGPNLLQLAAAHDLGRFGGALRQGIAASDGHALDPNLMPFREYSHLSPTEVGAVYAFLQSAGRSGSAP